MSVDGGRARNGISVAGFTRARFVQLIRNGSRVPVAAQAKYLARYCEGLGAKTIVVEQRYVDRHYLDYPNLSKIRRVIGGDDAEINELLLEKEQQASRWHNERQARHREEWKAKLKYDKEKGKLTIVEKRVYDLLKSGGHWCMQDIVAKFSPTSNKTLPDMLSRMWFVGPVSMQPLCR